MELLRNLLIRKNGGIFEKLYFTTQSHLRLEDFEKASDVLPKTIFNNISIQEKPEHRGTIGTIFIGFYKNIKVSIKIVFDVTKNNVKNDLNVIQSVGNMISKLFPHVSGMTNEICNKLSNETNIEREKEMCKIIRQKLSNNCPKGIKFLLPIPEFINEEGVFIYKYVDGITLHNIVKTHSKNVTDDIGSRIALCFFKAIYESKIIFGDMNPGNFIYTPSEDTVTFIDYGCVFEIDNNQRNQIIELHKAQKSRETLRAYLKKWNAPDILSDTIYEKSRIFYDKNPIANNTKFIDILQYTNITNCKLPPELILTIRATYQLIDLENYLDSTCVISSYFNLLR
jgi:predicted unusual protein kinase regulating ubiquinone biosynthesis (AarF/ABC1/UbiB family)